MLFTSSAWPGCAAMAAARLSQCLSCWARTLSGFLRAHSRRYARLASFASSVMLSPPNMLFMECIRHPVCRDCFLRILYTSIKHCANPNIRICPCQAHKRRPAWLRILRVLPGPAAYAVNWPSGRNALFLAGFCPSQGRCCHLFPELRIVNHFD